MTNEKRFKTVRERLEKFKNFCNKQKCEICCFKECDSESECALKWLDLNVEEMIETCPFCGTEARLISGTEDHYVVCRNDDCAAALVARSFSSEEEAIAAWNRRAK